jgi:shikimate dehydrogenase
MPYELRVIGNPIAHSQSPLIHTEFAKQLGLSVNYKKVLAPLDGLASTLNTLRQQGVSGVNITLPFKEQAFKLAYRVSKRAKLALAANTLLFEADGLYADNTDGIGLIRDIQQYHAYSLQDKHIVVCGAGGAVRGILYPLLSQHPKQVTLVNRHVEKAQALAKEYANWGRIQVLDFAGLANRDIDVIIDGTAYATEALPLPPRVPLSAYSLCYDLKYGKNLPFLSWAHAQGATLIHDGLGMLIEQAAEAFYLWTGYKPDTSEIRRHLLSAV